ncbi:MAG: GNAT family N-acetyltransferase [Armatimonas sp.]
MEIPSLPGKRVCLRALEESDVDAIFRLFSDPEAMRYWSFPAYTERAQAEEHLARHTERINDGNVIAWGIAKDQELIGTVALHKLDFEQGRCELGYMLGRSHWGQGLASEAISLALDYAFGRLHLRRLEADIDPRNTASQKLLEKLGFQQEGYLRERWNVEGEISDSALFGLLRREWEARDEK